MNKNLLKLKHIQEANRIMEKRLLSEQSIGPKRNLKTDLESGDILIVSDKQGKEGNIKVMRTLPSSGIKGTLNGKTADFLFGPAENQLKFPTTEPQDFDFTIKMIDINGQKYPVKEDGSY